MKDEGEIDYHSRPVVCGADWGVGSVGGESWGTCALHAAFVLSSRR